MENGRMQQSSIEYIHKAMNNPLIFRLVHNFSDQSEHDMADYWWKKILQFLKKYLGVSACKMPVFLHQVEIMRQALLLHDISFSTENLQYGNLLFIISIDDFLFLERNVFKGFYNDFYEDCELFRGEEKIAEVVSHEYWICFYVSGEERILLSYYFSKLNF